MPSSRNFLWWSLAAAVVAIALLNFRPEVPKAGIASDSPVAARPAAAPAEPERSAAEGDGSAPVTPPQPTPAALVQQAGAFAARLPVGPVRTVFLGLSPEAQTRAMRTFDRAAPPREDLASLRLTPTGHWYYSCDLKPTEGTPAAGSAEIMAAGSGIPLPQTGPQVAAASTVTAGAAVPISSPPIRHSKPGATRVVYLDFNGHTITGTSWNASSGVGTYVAKPFNLTTDGSNDENTFSDAEQALIIEVWSRIAEDFAPFDIDVTTEEPAQFTSTTGRVLMTQNVDANGVNMPSHTAGGVAFLGVFGDSDYATSSSPAFVYLTGTNAGNIAEAASHEFGHNLGLSHDGRVDDPATPESDPSEYYGGHGTGDISWGPIMGTGYGRNVSQWSKGEYYRANNTQDDFAIISSHLPYRTDEGGGTIAATGIATVTGGTLSTAGILAKVDDTDVLAFNHGGGSVSLTAATFVAATGTKGGNADLKLELLDANGNVLASDDPATTTGATLTASPAAGVLYARLTARGAGDPQATTPTGYTAYGSAGQYTLTGSFTAAAPAIVGSTTLSAPALASFTYQITATNAPTSYAASGLPAGLTLNSSTGVITGRPTATGSFPITLGATNTQGTGSGNLTLTITDAPPAVTAQTSGRQVVAIAGSLTLSVTALSANGAPTYQWRRNGRAVAGATSATLTLSPATMATAGVYQLFITNPIGTTRSAPIFVQVAPLASAVVGWGNNAVGQTTIPTGLTNAIAVAGGGSHALALKSDGTVVAWGSNSDGQASVPAGLTDVVAIAASGFVSGSSPNYTYFYPYSIALKADGTLVGWGNGAFGQLTFPADLSGVVAVTAGYYHAMALKSDGTVVAWGYNGAGQTEVPAGLTDVIDIAAGPDFSLALKADGTVVGWGYNGNGETNVPAGLNTAVQVSAGGFHSVALKSDGTVANWGFSSYGAAPGGFATGRQLSAGYRHTVALKTDGTVAAWGSNSDGQTTIPGGLTSAFGVSAGRYFSLAVRETSVPVAPSFTQHPSSQTVLVGGSVTFSAVASGNPAPTYQWYKGTTLLTGQTSASLTINPVTSADAGNYTVVATNSAGSATSNAAVLTVDAAPVVTVQTTTRRQLNPGGGFTHTVQATGDGPFTYQWYRNNRAIAGATAASFSVASATAADAGAYHAVVTNANGSSRSAPFFVIVAPSSTGITVWGDTASGQGTVPGGLTDAVSIAVGETHVLALKSDGTVAAWGGNANGQTTIPGGLANVVAVAAGKGHSVALKADGTVVAWGWNASGQSNVPGGLAGVIAIAAGDFHTYALKTDGTITAWGSNTIGQLTVPGGVGTVSVLETGHSHALVISNADVFSSWGNNGNGQATVPGGLTDAIATEGGAFHSLAVKSDGTVTAWGSNSSGQTTVPGGLSGVTRVAAGLNHSLALKSDGTVVAWGATGSGQTSVPGGLTQVIAIGAGGNTSVALRNTSLQAQTITFAALADRYFTATPIALSATASSGLAVTFSIVSGPATISGTTLTLTGTGTVVVRAAQAGDSTYEAATEVDRSFVVSAGFESWLPGYFTTGELADGSVSGPAADPDLDGLTNLVEYALGLDPKAANVTATPDVTTTASDWTYTYTRPASRADVTYVVEVSTNLTSWTATGVTHTLVSTSGGVETWQASYPLASATNVFFRLRVDRP